jgi:DNA-binding LytR/AlgR family response regulator
MPSAVIAEDEKLLREELAALLGRAWPELSIVAQCDDGASALEAIAERKPDVAFLDIRMPGLTGMEVAAAAAEASPATQVVFVTAYDQYAIDAFHRGAVDYLLKPIAPERLAATVQRLKSRAAPAAGGGSFAAILEELRARIPPSGGKAPLQWITASVGKETRLIMVDDVAYFRAEDKYTVVAAAAGDALIRKPIRELLDQLDPSVFKQVHRSTIVNLKAIAGVTRDDAGRGTIRLRTRPDTLAVSLTFMPLFRNM